MRNGVLVGEDSPNTLISKQYASTLEEAFISLCCIQESGKVRITINKTKQVHDLFLLIDFYIIFKFYSDFE